MPAIALQSREKLWADLHTNRKDEEVEEDRLKDIR